MNLLHALFSLALLSFPAKPTEQPKYTPQNLIIATDLDDVLLKRRKSKIFCTIVKKFGKCKKLYTNYNKRKKIDGSKNEKFGEGFYLYLKQEGYETQAKIIKEICGAKRFKKRTLNIMRNMAKQGYEIHTATNIGNIFFAELQKKFPETFNKAFIKHCMTVDYSKDEVIQKPDLRYFDQLNKKLNPHNDKNILFIDDKLENVKAARKRGILAIHYTSAKQLKRELHNYGICTCK